MACLELRGFACCWAASTFPFSRRIPLVVCCIFIAGDYLSEHEPVYMTALYTERDFSLLISAWICLEIRDYQSVLRMISVWEQSSSRASTSRWLLPFLRSPHRCRQRSEMPNAICFTVPKSSGQKRKALHSLRPDYSRLKRVVNSWLIWCFEFLLGKDDIKQLYKDFSRERLSAGFFQ